MRKRATNAPNVLSWDGCITISTPNHQVALRAECHIRAKSTYIKASGSGQAQPPLQSYVKLVAWDLNGAQNPKWLHGLQVWSEGVLCLHCCDEGDNRCGFDGSYHVITVWNSLRSKCMPDSRIGKNEIHNVA